MESFSKIFGPDSFEIRRVEMVGPKVGRDLREKGFMAVICSLAGMLIYIWIRFQLQWGFAAVVALTIDEQSYGPEHPEVAIRLNNLARLLKATNRLDNEGPDVW